MVLTGAHYLPFASLYGMRMFLALAAILIGMGVVIALYFSAMLPGRVVRRADVTRLCVDWGQSSPAGVSCSTRGIAQ